MTAAYSLQWPESWSRTDTNERVLALLWKRLDAKHSRARDLNQCARVIEFDRTKVAQ